MTDGRLESAELGALARGRLAAGTVSKLTAAELVKHRVLVEVVRRRAINSGSGPLVDHAAALLSEVEARAPAVAAEVLALPQVGEWAIACLRRMPSAEAAGTLTAVRERPILASERQHDRDLGYLAALAAAAALRAGLPFEQDVPLLAGKLLLPGAGMIRLRGPGYGGTTRVRCDGARASVVVDGDLVRLPVGAELLSGGHVPGWLPVPRLTIEADDRVLDLLVDAADPFLAQLSVHADPSDTAGAGLAPWRQILHRAWALLVGQHRPVATALARMARTLVPLAANPASAKPRSATSGWMFGAIGLSRPADHVLLAEALVHELQHLVLTAVEDLVPLVRRERRSELGYAAWRDDPRPPDGLLHGCYAYLGVTKFWRRRCRRGPADELGRSAAEFALWREATLGVTESLAESGTLTGEGLAFARTIRDRLARWRDDPVSAEAALAAADARAEHRARWRLVNLRADEAWTDAAARAWLAGTAQPLPQPRVTLSTEHEVRPVPPGLGHLLAARYQDPPLVQRLLAEPCQNPPGPLPADGADLALLRGDYPAAEAGYVDRLRSGDDPQAWVGLAIALRRCGSGAGALLIAERPEVVAAVHARVRARDGSGPDPRSLAAWLGQVIPADVSSPSG